MSLTNTTLASPNTSDLSKSFNSIKHFKGNLAVVFHTSKSVKVIEIRE